MTNMDNFCIYCQKEYKDLAKHVGRKHPGTYADASMNPAPASDQAARERRERRGQRNLRNAARGGYGPDPVVRTAKAKRRTKADA